MTSRVRVLGLLAVGVAWGCGGTATHGDSEASETDAGGSSFGFGGDFGDGSGGSGASDSTGGGSTATATGGPTTRGNDSTAATTRGGTTRGDTTRGDTTNGDTTNGDTTNGTTDGDTTNGTTDGDTTNGQSDVATSGTSSSSGSAVTNGAGGAVGTSDNVSTTANTTASTTVGTTGNGGFGGDTTSGTATFSSSSVVTSTTGMPEPDPDLDDYPYLQGCDDNYWTVSTTYCNLGFSCSGQTGYSSCWDIGGGEIACDCNHDYYWYSYRLEGSNFEDACAYATSACIAGPEVESEQPVCTPTSLYQATTYCSASADCRISVDIEGADITRAGTNYASCEEREDSWVCNCDTPKGQVTVTLGAEDGSAEMCVDALGWCNGELTREGPRSCRPSSQSAQANSCYANLLCTQDALVDDLPATLSETFTLNCQEGESGAWVCDCPGTGSFEVEADTAWDACTLGASECTPE